MLLDQTHLYKLILAQENMYVIFYHIDVGK